MSVGVGGLYFKVANFIGLVHFDGPAKRKWTILAFLYCGKFVKNGKISVFGLLFKFFKNSEGTRGRLINFLIVLEYNMK